MGAGPSVPSSEDIRKQTRSASELTKLILNWMLTKSNLADLYALAAPSECRKYIVSTAESLPKLFKEIKLLPRKDSTGKIYFQTIADFRQVPPELMERQQPLCLELSFFFIRILQIFSALTLSVIDTEVPSSDYMMETVKEVDRKPLTYDQFYDIPGFTQRRQKGGVLRYGTTEFIKDTNYSLLNRYLTKGTGNTFDLTSSISIDGSSLYPQPQPILNYRGKDEDDRPVSIRARLRIEKLTEEGEQTTKYKIELKPILKNGKAAASYADDKIPRGEGYIGPITFKSDLGDDPTYNNATLPQFISKEFKRLLGKEFKEEDIYEKKKTRKFSEIPYGEIPPPLQLKELWDGLTSKPPVKAYCVSRALQLLSPSSIYGDLPMEAKTSICNMKFSLYGKGSLPKPGGPILESKGLLSLNLLFFDFLQKTMPSIADDTKKKYAPFLDQLRAIYEEEVSIKKSGSESILTEAGTIRDKIPTTLCGTGTGKLFTKDTTVIKGLRTYVTTLLNRQMTHTAAVMTLLGKLFVVSDDTPSLHPSIQERGMVRVEELATEARDLLSAYYQDCEVVYRQGVVFAASNKAAFRPDAPLIRRIAGIPGIIDNP